MSVSNSIFPKLSAAHAKRLIWASHDRGAILPIALRLDPSSEAFALKKLPDGEQVETLLRVLLDRADPTTNKRFTQWLARQYAAGRLILEDLGTAHDTLTLFQRYAPRLAPEARDIQRYASLAGAWEAVRGFAERDEAHSNRARKALDRAKAYEESRILRQDSDGFTVAVPLTEFAAKWWGRGTRWCTASAQDNRFWDYHDDAPLLVFVLPEHGKFQLWCGPDNVEFMDASDQPVSSDALQEVWPFFAPYLSLAVKKNGAALRWLPVEYRSAQICLDAVRRNGKALEWVPPDRISQEMCSIAVAQCSDALMYVPDRFRTYDLCLAAARQSVHVAMIALAAHPTHEMALVVARNNGNSLRDIPKHLLCPEIYHAAVQNNGMALAWVYQKHRNAALCLAAVEENGGSLTLVPNRLRTKKLYLTAVRTANCLEQVHVSHRCEEVCREACTYHWEAFEHVPQALQSEELLLLAVRRGGRVLAFAPQSLLTQQVCDLAVEVTPSAISFVPCERLTPQLCRNAVSRNGSVLRYLPDDFRTFEICQAALKQNPSALGAVPLRFRTEEICRDAVARYGRSLLHVPEEFLSLDLCLIAAENDRSALQFIPKKWLSDIKLALKPRPISLPSWPLENIAGWREVSIPEPF